MRCVTGEKNAAEAKFRGDFSVALKTRGIFHVDERRAGHVPPQDRGGVRHQIRILRTRAQVNAKALTRKRGENNRKSFEKAKICSWVSVQPFPPASKTAHGLAISWPSKAMPLSSRVGLWIPSQPTTHLASSLSILPSRSISAAAPPGC